MSNAYPEYVEDFSIEISDFDPISPTCHIPLHDTMPKRNNGIINMQNNDEWCFGWCVLGALHPVKDHPERNPHQIHSESRFSGPQFSGFRGLTDKFSKPNFSIIILS